MLTTFVVTSLDDNVSRGVGTLDDVGTSLRSAVFSANENPGPDIIEFSPELIGSVDLFAGQLDITDSVTIRGNGSANTTINAQNNSRVFTIYGAATHVAFLGLTITGGASEERGGGIRSIAEEGSTLELTDCIVSNNTSTTGGGGIYTQSLNSVTITDSRITGNSTTGDNANGGGFYAFNGGTLTINQSEISGNSTSGGGSKGGALYWYNGDIALNDSLVEYNATHGDGAKGGAFYQTKGTMRSNNTYFFANHTDGSGAHGGTVSLGSSAELDLDHGTIFAYGQTTGQLAHGGAIYSPSGTISVNDSFFRNNGALGLGSNGGAISLGTGNLAIDGSQFRANEASGPFIGGEVQSSSGGALYVANGTVTITSSSLLSNTANGSGGGAFVSSGSLAVVNSTISGNTVTRAASKGGGLAVGDASLTMDSSTVAFNKSGSNPDTGGGVHTATGSVEIHNSIVAKNTGGAPDLNAPPAAAFIVTNSLIGVNTGSGLAASSTPNAQGNIIGTTAVPIDPLLDPINGNGGPPTHALRPGSPALNRGDNARANTLGLTVDETGRNRFAGSATDMGAFELQAPSLDSIVRDPNAENPTTGSGVKFIVGFSEVVTGLTASSFSVNATGSVQAGTITVVSIDGQTYEITVNGVSGAGELGLTYTNDGSVLSTTTALPVGEATVVSSESFTIKEPPVLSVNAIEFVTGATSPTTATSVSFKITFSAEVINVAASQFQVVKTGTVASGTPQLTGSGKDYIVTVSGITGAGTLGLNFQDDGTVVRATDGQHMTQASLTGAVYEIVKGTQGNVDLDVGGLRFHVVSGGNFTTAGSLNSVAGQVQVGFVPTGGGAFVALAAMSGTVSVNSADGTFSATGAFKAVIGNVERTMFVNGVSNVSISQLISSGISLGGGAPLSVAGASFTLTTFGFTPSPQPAITLRGSLTLPKGITIAVDGDNSVVINASGIRLNGASLSLTNSFTVAGVTFSADQLTANYNPTGNVFSLTGTASVSVTDIANLSVNFTGTGLVVNNGVFSSIDATVNGQFQVKGVKFSPTNLHLKFSEATQQFSMSGGASVEIAGFEASLAVTFGSPQSPGVVITNGVLNSLDMAVNGQFKVSKVNVAAQNLQITYASGKFTFSGTAKVTIGGLGDLSVQFGTDSTPGMIVNNGSLTKLDMAITAQFEVAKVKVTANALRLVYDAPTKSFAFTGTAGIAIAGIAGDQANNSISVTFGFEGQPGMVVTEGNLESLDLTVNATFNVSKVSITATDLRMTFTAATSLFALSGTAAVKIKGVDGVDGDSVAVTFGGGDSLGLVIQNGSLSSLDMTVDGQFQVAKVGVTAEALRLTFSAGVFTLSGTAKVTIGGLGDLSVQFGDGTTPGMVVTDGNLVNLDMIVNAQFEVAKVKITADSLRLRYDAAAKSFSLSGTAGLIVAGIAGSASDNSIAVTFGFEDEPGLVVTNGTLDRLDLTINATFKVAKVSITATDLRFTYVAATNSFSMSGTAAVKVDGIQGANSDNSFAVTFGFQGSPGLVIENGALKSLDITINATLNVAKVQIKATDLRFTFVAATSAFTLSGTAGVKIDGIQGANSDNSFAVTFGFQGSPGLVIENGALKSLDITVNATVNVAKVQIKATDLRFTYVAATSSFSLSGTAAVKVDGIQGANLDNSFAVTFGFQGAPGLVVENGALKSLDITINATFNVAKVQIKATDLRFTYTAATNSFSLGGTAGITVKGIQGANLDNSFAVTFGFKGAPGIVIENGALKSLDITINATLSVTQVQIKVTDLRFTYEASTQTFTFAGTAAIVVRSLGADLSITFGAKDTNGVQQPGLVIVNGTLERLDMTLNAGFRVANALQVNIKDVRFTYTRASNEFTLSGGVSLSPVGLSDLANISATLGDATKPGVVIQNGTLVSLHFKIDAYIKVSALSVTGQLVLDYTRATDTVLISGVGSISVAGIGQLSVKLGDFATGTQGLVIVGGRLVKFDMTITTNLSLAGLTLNGKLVMNYSSFTGAFTATGDVTLNIGTIGNVTAKLGGSGTKGLVITNGSLTSLDLLASANFSVGPLTMSGSLTMTYQKSTSRFVMFGTANGSFLGQSLFTVEVGNANAPGLIVSNGSLQNLTIKLTGTFTILGVRLGQVSLSAVYEASRGRYFFSGNAGIDLPSFIPDWLASVLGGRTLASIGVELNVIANNNRDSYFQAKATIAGIEFGFRSQFDGGLTFIGDPVFSAIANGVVNVVDTVKNALVDAWNWFWSWWGPLEGADVFYDAAFNFNLASAPHSVTGADGRFLGVVPQGATTGQVVVVGGLDRSTGLTNPLRLTAPFMAKVISPLTSLVNQLMQQRDLSVADAITVVNQSLGIPLSTNLVGQSLAFEATGGDAQSARSFAREIQVGTVVHEICSLLSGLQGAPSVAELSTDGFAAIAAMLGESGGAALNLADEDVIQEIINRTAESASLTLNSAITTGAARVNAGINQSIDALPVGDVATYLNRLLQFQTVAQGSLAPDLARVTSGQLGINVLVNNYTGTALITRVNAATFGELNIIGSAIAITPVVSQSVGVGQPQTFDFQVFLSANAPRNVPVTVNFATRDQSATVANGDFEQTTGTLTWLPGDVAPKTISVPVHAANSDLATRLFTVELTNALNAEIVNTFAIGDIESAFFGTTTTVSSTDTTADFGQSITFTATVTNLDPNHTIPEDGTVDFFDGNLLLGSSVVDDGIARFTTNTLSGGTHTIRADYSGLILTAEKYLPSQSSGLVETVGKITQSITFPSIANVDSTDAPFAIDASSSSGLPLSFRVVSGAASVNENVLTLIGPGTVVLEATQIGDENFSSATPVTRTFTILDSNTGESNTAPVAITSTIQVGVGQTVSGQLLATDADNDTLTFSIGLEPEHGTIVVNQNGSFQYTAVQGFQGIDTFTFFANDGQLISNQATVTVLIGNPNLPPVVNAATFSILENSAAASAVGSVTATDPNAGQTKLFSITAGNTGSAFAINQNTGAITVANAAALDFETNPSFNLTVQASDNGSPSLSGTATITINLTNVNEAPIVTPATFSIAENSAVNAAIGTVSASDPDANQTKSFSIINGNTGNAFAINPNTGAITVANSSALNFEATATFNLTVQVADNGNPSKSGVAAVKVNLTNVNEAPTVTPATFSIAENSATNTAIGTVVAADPDANQTKTFSITGGNTGNAFLINATTGAITVAPGAVLDFETKPSFTLTVQATDNGSPALSGSGNVTINLTNVAEQVTLGGGSGTVTYKKAQAPVALMPNITVQSGGNVASLSQIEINIFVPKKGILSDVRLGSAASLGTVTMSGPTDFKKASGTHKVTITLNDGVTDAQVQAFLRSISFSTKKMDPAKKSLGRKIDVKVFNRQGTASNQITTQILAQKK